VVGGVVTTSPGFEGVGGLTTVDVAPEGF